MLEILAAILIGRSFGKKAVTKGLPKGKWTAIGVLSFLLTAWATAVLLVVATEEPLSAVGGYVAGAIACAIAFNSLKSKPDAVAESVDEFGSAATDVNFEEKV